MLTTSENPDDIARAKAISHVSEYITKPLSKELVDNISERYFQKLIKNL